MPITNSSALELIKFFRKANVVNLIDEDYYSEEDYDGNIIHHEAVKWNRIGFEVTINFLAHLVDEFKEELVTNKYIVGFNKELYCSEVIQDCESILALFESRSVNDFNLRLRRDAVFKHNKIGEVVTFIDSDGNPFNKSIPVQISPMPFDELKQELLEEISNYFIYQEKILKTIITNLRKELLNNKVRGSKNTSYKYEYFKFNNEDIGDDHNEYINDFFNELSQKGYVGSESIKSLKNFFQNKGSLNKVTWKKNKNELWYLISQMVKRKIIHDTKRVKADIIPKVFLDKEGKEFKKKDFKSVHAPANKRVINDLLGILIPAKSSRKRC